MGRGNGRWNGGWNGVGKGDERGRKEGRKGGGKDIVRKMHVFTDMEISGIQKSGVLESRIPRVPESNQLI